MRQKTLATTRAGKLAEAAIKQIATQKLQTEKERMREWKQVIMQEVAHELHAIRQAHEEAMEGQRYGFQMELEKVREGFQMELGKVREELHQVEARSTTLECEINAQKGQKQSPKPRPTQDMLATKKVPIIPPSTKLPKRKEPVNPPYKSYAQIAASGSPKIATKKAWTKVIGNSYRRKATTPNMSKVEPEKQRIIFRREALSPQKSEADLMLALNEWVTCSLELFLRYLQRNQVRNSWLKIIRI